MPFKYSCFISYRHGQKELVERFVTDLSQALSNEVVPLTGMEVFVDWQRLQGGDFFDPNLARALCESVCLIIVFTPTYFSDTHIYCAREYKGMEMLETQRLKLLSVTADKEHGLIIPIVLRSEGDLPSEVKDHRQYHDFTKFALWQKNLTRSKQYAPKIEAIAQYIHRRHQALSALPDDPCVECETFSLPGEDEIRTWLGGMKAPQAPFPGR
jgi:hypothetical protein